MLQFLEGSLFVQNSVALPRNSLDLSGLTNSITSALAIIKCGARALICDGAWYRGSTGLGPTGACWRGPYRTLQAWAP